MRDWATILGPDYLYIEMLRVYSSEYGLHLVAGDTYQSFKDPIRWQVGEKIKSWHQKITADKDMDYTGIVRFGDVYIGW